MREADRQFARPEIYRAPLSKYVARFIGSPPMSSSNIAREAAISFFEWAPFDACSRCRRGTRRSSPSLELGVRASNVILGSHGVPGRSTGPPSGAGRLWFRCVARRYAHRAACGHGRLQAGRAGACGSIAPSMSCFSMP